jgi:hypothetical protein
MPSALAPCLHRRARIHDGLSVRRRFSGGLERDDDHSEAGPTAAHDDSAAFSATAATDAPGADPATTVTTAAAITAAITAAGAAPGAAPAGCGRQASPARAA